MPERSPLSVYQGDAGRQYHEGKRALPHGTTLWVARVRARLFQSQISTSDHVLEWGCGYGWNLAALHCRTRWGYDVTPELGPAVQALGIEFTTQVDQLPVGGYDVILCHHALEHMPNPSEVLQQLGRLCKPDGKLLLAVPYESERRYRRFDPLEPNHHLFSWNPQTLGNLLRSTGWESVSLGLRRYGYDRRAAQLAVQARVGERGFRLIRKLLQTVIPLREVAAVARRAAAE